MRLALIPAATAFALLAACKPQPISPADEQAIRANDSAFAVALNAGNVDGVVAMYASDAKVLPPGMAMASGTDAIRRLMHGMMDPMKFTMHLNPATVSGQGDLAYVVGSFHFTAAPKDSTQAAPPPADGKYVEVHRRQADGSWKIVADIWNENEAPAPAAPARPARRH